MPTIELPRHRERAWCGRIRRTRRAYTLIAIDVRDPATHRRRLASVAYRAAVCGRSGCDVLHVHDYRSRLTQLALAKEAFPIVRYICANEDCEAHWQVLPGLVARWLCFDWPLVEEATIAEPREEPEALATVDTTTVRFDPPVTGRRRAHSRARRGARGRALLAGGAHGERAGGRRAVPRRRQPHVARRAPLRPSMVGAMPRAQWRSEYPVLIPRTYERSVAVTASPRGVPVQLDGEALRRSAETQGEVDYRHVDVARGQHRFDSPAFFGLVIVGHARDVSDAYPGGGSFELINE